MLNTNNTLSTNAHRFDFVGWRAYNEIKKKAMEQKFSMSGLIISLSIAFFVVILSAYILNVIYVSIEEARKHEIFLNQKIYQLENKELLDTDIISDLKNMISIPTAYASEVEYQGGPVLYTHHIDIEAGEAKEYEVVIKNTGDKIWEEGEVSLEIGPYLKSFSKVKHNSWLKYYQIEKINKNINPGESVIIKFYLQSPDNINGIIQENFYLVVNNRIIPGTEMRFFMSLKSIDMVFDEPQNSTIIQEVVNEKTEEESAFADSAFVATSAKEVATADKEDIDFCNALTEVEKEEFIECQTNSNENDVTSGISENIQYSEEPTIRVGLFNTKSAQRLTSNTKYDVYSGDRLILQNLSARFVSTVSYNTKRSLYIISTSGITKFLDKPIRFVPVSENGIMTLFDFDNRARWNNSINYNQYRNIVEFNYSLNTGRLWIINELPISSYLKGLTETTNYSPVDYQKVIATAARTYALYHYNRGIEYDIPDGSTKHANEHFHLDATYDQVYKGYVSESLLSRLNEAVDATKGIAVTYNKAIVVTPYFSRSDGRTRSWQEVWYGGDKPWLQSVDVPEDKGETLWGHGVGMSAQAALEMVRDKLINWEKVLKHFYTDINLQKIY